MNHAQKIMVIAESDAIFDGYEEGLVHLSRVNRERYIARATRSYYALQQSIHENIKSKLKFGDLSDVTYRSDRKESGYS